MPTDAYSCLVELIWLFETEPKHGEEVIKALVASLHDMITVLRNADPADTSAV